MITRDQQSRAAITGGFFLAGLMLAVAYIAVKVYGL